MHLRAALVPKTVGFAVLHSAPHSSHLSGFCLNSQPLRDERLVPRPEVASFTFANPSSLVQTLA